MRTCVVMAAVVERQCTATSKRTHERCLRPPMVGAGRCYHHLGQNPRVHMAEQALQRQARRLAQVTEYEPIDVDAVLEEHLALAGAAKQWKDILAGLVAQLTDVGYASKAGEQTRAAVKEYGAALDRCDKILTAINRLGIEARVAAVAEQQEQRLRAVLLLALRDLGHELTDVTVARAIQAAIAATEPTKTIRGPR